MEDAAGGEGGGGGDHVQDAPPHNDADPPPLPGLVVQLVTQPVPHVQHGHPAVGRRRVLQQSSI